MLEVSAYCTTGPDAPLAPMRITRRDLRSRDVLIAIASAGICHSDIHHARADWRDEIYPLVSGHEIAGTVTAVGSEVTRFEVGVTTTRPTIRTPSPSWPASSTSSSTP